MKEQQNGAASNAGSPKHKNGSVRGNYHPTILYPEIFHDLYFQNRFALVRTINNIRFVNDGSASTVNAAWYAFSSLEGRIIWITAGSHANLKYDEKFLKLIKNKVEAIVCMDQNTKVDREFGTISSIEHVHDMETAVRTAYEIAGPGNTVLFTLNNFLGIENSFRPTEVLHEEFFTAVNDLS